MNARDIDRALASYHPDIVLHSMLASATGGTGEFRGHEGVRAVLDFQETAFRDGVAVYQRGFVEPAEALEELARLVRG